MIFLQHNDCFSKKIPGEGGSFWGKFPLEMGAVNSLRPRVTLRGWKNTIPQRKLLLVAYDKGCLFCLEGLGNSNMKQLQ